MVDTAQNIDAYLAPLSPEFRAKLERIHTLVPELRESMSYGMPTLAHRGRTLVYSTASQWHLSFYPSSWANDALRDRLKGVSLSTHAIRFTPAQRLLDELIIELVRAHQREIDAQPR